MLRSTSVNAHTCCAKHRRLHTGAAPITEDCTQVLRQSQKTAHRCCATVPDNTVTYSPAHTLALAADQPLSQLTNWAPVCNINLCRVQPNFILNFGIGLKYIGGIRLILAGGDLCGIILILHQSWPASCRLGKQDLHSMRPHIGWVYGYSHMVTWRD